MRVAPYTGAWIEIFARRGRSAFGLVAPYTGAWIEILKMKKLYTSQPVAPYTGAWIEIPGGDVDSASEICRSLHGSVD